MRGTVEQTAWSLFMYSIKPVSGHSALMGDGKDMDLIVHYHEDQCIGEARDQGTSNRRIKRRLKKHRESKRHSRHHTHERANILKEAPRYIRGPIPIPSGGLPKLYFRGRIEPSACHALL